MDDRDMPPEHKYVYMVSSITHNDVCHLPFFPVLYYHQRKEYLFTTITHLSERH